MPFLQDICAANHRLHHSRLGKTSQDVGNDKLSSLRFTSQRFRGFRTSLDANIDKRCFSAQFLAVPSCKLVALTDTNLHLSTCNRLVPFPFVHFPTIVAQFLYAPSEMDPGFRTVS